MSTAYIGYQGTARKIATAVRKHLLKDPEDRQDLTPSLASAREDAAAGVHPVEGRSDRTIPATNLELIQST